MASARTRPLRVLLVGLRYDPEYRHSLSLGYLKAYADSLPALAGRVEVALDERTVHESLAAQVRSILEARPDVVGFSCYLWNMHRVLELGRALKSSAPGLRLVLGGPEVSTRPRETLAELPEADVVACGEGELTFAELLDALAGTRPLDGIPGLLFRRGGDLVPTPERPLIPDLSILPSPYLNGIFRVRDGDRLALETSRGCPLQCRFCDWQNFQKTRWFPAERALAEVEAVAAQATGIYYFVTDADLFTDSPRAVRLLEGFRRIVANHGTHWHFQTYLGNIDAEIAPRLDSYQYSLGAGIETISPRALKRMVRGFGRRGVEKALALLREKAPQISVHIQLIHALPADDLAGYRRSLEWALSMRSDSLFLPRALALPGAEFGKHPEEYGITAAKEAPYRVLCTDTFPPDQVEAADWLAFRVLNLHLPGALRRTMEFLGTPPQADAETAGRTPWVDRYERLHAHLEASTGFFGRIAAWYRRLGDLGKVMEQEPLRWENQPVSERVEGLRALADFARRELQAEGRLADWAALEGFLRTAEARVLWERLLESDALGRVLGLLLEGVPMASERIAWLGWENLGAERGFCHRAWMGHLLSTLNYSDYDACLVPGSRHLQLEERADAAAWEALLPPPERGVSRLVLSNVAHALPARLRRAFLAAARRRCASEARLTLWFDSAGISPLELVSPEAARGADEEKASAEGVLADLAAAGWEPERAPFTLAAAGPLNGTVRWTFISARVAGVRGKAAERALAREARG